MEVKYMREDWIAARGIEIENRRMLGKRTIFIYDEPIVSIINHQLYFTEKYLSKHGFERIIDYVPRFDVTLELSLDLLRRVPPSLWECHFVVTFDHKDLDKYIKLSDTIRIVLDDYHTASVTFADMLITNPPDYIGDECAGKK